VIISLKSSFDPKAREPWMPYPKRGESVPGGKGRNTLIEALDTLFLEDAIEAVDDSLVFWIEERLVD
jgi:hypothetical protein